MSQAKSDNRVEDIWTSIEKEPKTGEKQNGTSVVFIGDLSSGKTTLINSFLKPKDVKENTKPTIALDYNFARKVVGNAKVVANFWEIGGDVVEPKLIEVTITKDNLGLASAVVVCDLSSPQNVLSSLQRSIAAYKEIISKRADELKATNVNELNEIRQRVTTVYREHVDTNRVRPTEVPLYIIANKLDAFKTLSLPDRRSISQILRFTAHYYGATLLTVAASLSSAFPDTTTKEIFRKLMDCIAFGQPVKPAYEVNPDKYLYVTKGMDSFEKILLGAGSDSQGSETDTKVKNRLLSSESEIDLFITNKGVTKDSWKRMAAHLSSLFGEPDPVALNAAAGKDAMETGGADAKGGSTEDALHQEPEVDDMREVRREALRRYIQEAERKEALLAKMDARGGGSSSNNNN